MTFLESNNWTNMLLKIGSSKKVLVELRVIYDCNQSVEFAIMFASKEEI